MNLIKSIAISAALLSMPACASIVDGSSQELVINTTPAGADCVVNRGTMPIARVSPTPGGVVIKKTKDDITILCNKKGYEEATYFGNSGSQGSTWGNIVLGGGIGWAIDSASGSDNKYESPVNIALSKK